MAPDNIRDLELYFQFRCEKGLQQRGLEHVSAYRERLQYEINTICQLGFASYFLVVSDIVRWAIAQGIPVGPGRGSAGGSIVSYCLYITHLDPIKHGLIFERFLNPERISPPDIDLDFCESRRNEIFQYVKEKYGPDRVAHIGTYGTLKARAAIRDVARILGAPYQTGDALANLILPPIEGKSQSLAVCFDKVPELRNLRNGIDSDLKNILVWAEQFEDRLRSFGTHASGFIISDTPIGHDIPLYRGIDDIGTTQFEMYTVEEVGFVKFDFLGLSALTTIDRCVKSVAKRYGITINPLDIPLDDQETFAMLRSGNVEGIFQMEGSSGIRDLLVQIRPTKLDDLALLVAIYRPGPLGSKLLADYLKVRAGEIAPSFLDPSLEPILGPTDGLLIFQEQVLEIAKQLAGYTLGEADLLRRAIGKKKQKEMDAQKVKFQNGIQKHGLSLSVAETLWEDINNFAGYGFNKSHAACYGYIGYMMAYFKCHYPLDFMWSCLVAEQGNDEKIIRYLAHARSANIQILPPSINDSDANFTITENHQIRFGLSVIKHMGQSVKTIIKERNRHGAFSDILDFAERIGLNVNKRQFESLVLSGVFDQMTSFGRASLLGAIDNIMQYREEKKRYDAKLLTYQKRLTQYQERQAAISEWPTLDTTQKKGRKKPVSIKVPVQPQPPSIPQIPLIPEMPIPERLKQEHELLGYYVSGHPLDLVKNVDALTIETVKEKPDGLYTVLAIPSLIKEITTKKHKKLMAYVILEDKTGTIQGIIFPTKYHIFTDIVKSGLPALYSGTLETVRSDEEKTYKFLIQEIIPLKDHQIQTTPCQVVIDLKQATSLAQFLATHAGHTSQVQLFATSGKNLWNFGLFACNLKEDEIQQYVAKQMHC